MKQITTEVLVVGGGTGGAAAAIQCARQGAQTVLVSEFPWLGGMLTAAGVPVPDGNELAAFQTGIWGAFLRELEQRQPGGLDRAWVSFFSYDPAVGAQIFADWVGQLPNLKWIAGQSPLEVLKQENRITGVRFEDYTIQAQLVLDGTELGDLLALGEVPYRWGWEWQSEWQEPSAPKVPGAVTEQYPVQAPTWVVILQDFGPEAQASEIPADPREELDQFLGAWQGYRPEQFLNYGRLPGDRFMLNWPQCGNDYGRGLERLIGSPQARREFWQEARSHSQSFARFIQTQLGRRYGLAEVFPRFPSSPGGGAFALYPYYRESRRLQGLAILTERDILPVPGGAVAPLPLNPAGQVESIAIGNYANDHHYPGYDFPLAPKSLRWGGRWTGTPFTIPFRALIPAETDGLLVCEKNISVSHMANGATRLQPVVLGIGQAAGMAAALCVQQGCQPRQLSVRQLQEALLHDPIAPAAVVPLLNLVPKDSKWVEQQQVYLDRPQTYPIDGNDPSIKLAPPEVERHLPAASQQGPKTLSGHFHCRGEQDYVLTVTQAEEVQTWALVTLQPSINQQFQQVVDGKSVTVNGFLNPAGAWIRVESIAYSR